jgi:hypothetical protein
MIHLRHAALGLLFGALLALPVLARPGSDPFQGVWGGVLKDRERQRVELVIEADRKATLFTLDAREVLYPSALRTRDEAIHIEFRQLSGVFDGRLVTPHQIDGVWRQAGRRTKISLRRQASASVPFVSRGVSDLRRR